jgi:phage shock protein A
MSAIPNDAGGGMDKEGEVQRSSFEKHAQTTIQVAIAALLTWVGNAVVGVRDSNIRLEVQYSQVREELQSVKADVAALRSAVGNIATSTGGFTLQDMERRVSRMERAAASR